MIIRTSITLMRIRKPIKYFFCFVIFASVLLGVICGHPAKGQQCSGNLGRSQYSGSMITLQAVTFYKDIEFSTAEGIYPADTIFQGTNWPEKGPNRTNIVRTTSGLYAHNCHISSN